MPKDYWGDGDEGGGLEISKTDGTRIVNSLAKILYQTSRHLCVNTGLSLGTVIDWIEGNGDEVYGEQVGNIWVYYLKDNMPARLAEPKKLYFGGADGRTVCLRDAPDRGNTGNRRVGEKVVLDLPKPLFDEKPPSRSRQLVDAEELFDLASINPDFEYIADELEIGVSQLKVYIGNQPNLKRAFEKGRKIYMENNRKENNDEKTAPQAAPKKPIAGKATAAPQSNGKVPAKRLTLKDMLTPEIVEQAAFEGLTNEKIAARLGLKSKYAFQQVGTTIRQTASLLKASERGKNRRLSTNIPKLLGRKKSEPNPENSTAIPESESAATDFVIAEKVQEMKKPIELPAQSEPIVEAEKTFPAIIQSSVDREKLEEIKSKLISTNSDFSSGVNFRRAMDTMKMFVPILSVGFIGDLSALTPRQREIIDEILNLKDEFQKEES